MPSLRRGKRITINLAPADTRKAGPSYDLPIAVGVLIASEQVWPQAVEGALFVGELSLDGSVRHVNGVLPIPALAHEQSIGRVFVPAVDAPEAALIDGLEVIPVEHLSDVMFVAAMNPCPCGYYGDPVHECTCSMSTISRYQEGFRRNPPHLGAAPGPHRHRGFRREMHND